MKIPLGKPYNDTEEALKEIKKAIDSK